MKVWIVQCLCPARHCIAAVTCEAESQDEARNKMLLPMREGVEAALTGGMINPWCGLCHAPAAQWKCELAPTKFATMAEAAPELVRMEREQEAVRIAFGDMKRDRPH